MRMPTKAKKTQTADWLGLYEGGDLARVLDQSCVYSYY